MKVKDFIELLKNKPQDADIEFYHTGYDEFINLSSIEEFPNDNGKKIELITVNFQ